MATVDFFTGFTYKWAQTGNTFAWDDAQYKLGWATVGDTPPTVEQFNRVHQIADEKSNWLYGQLKTVADAKSVTLSAGSLTGLQQVLAAYGQSSTIDATLGRWMQVGAFGLGSVAPSYTAYGYPADFNLMDAKTGTVTVNGSITNGPSGAAAASYSHILEVTLRGGSVNISAKQELFGYPDYPNAKGSWIRYGTGAAGARTWTAWEQVLTSRTTPQATTTTVGVARIATTVEAQTGTDDTTIMTPRTVAQAKGTKLLATYSTPGAVSFTVPAGVYAIEFEVLGAGGGGGAGGSSGAGTGGGAGGWGYKQLAVTPGQVLTGVVGASGNGGVGAGTTGGNGGATTFGGVTANGGTGGSGNATGGGFGGSVTGADYNVPGGQGNGGAPTNSAGTIVFGPPGGLASRQVPSISGYSSTDGIVGRPGCGGGGGTGGTAATRAGGNGGAGLILIWG